MDWDDTPRGRDARDRQAARAVPENLLDIPRELRDLLRRWAREESGKRKRSTLLGEARNESIEDAERLCDLLLRTGWIVRHERLSGGHWQWEAITWRDLPQLQHLLGIAGRDQRAAERQHQLRATRAWLDARAAATAAEALDPDLLDELARALAQLESDKALRPDLLQARLALLQALAAWHDTGAHGLRRDFALRARGATKALTEADWRWLEAGFDLERLRIARFAPVAWLAGDLVLHWHAHTADLRALQFTGLALTDLQRASAATGPRRWWLIENRASFERQAQQRQPGELLAWLPGRPSSAWLKTLDHLLTLAPAPAWISADADPAGVDIACTAGALWATRGLAWEPHRMGVEQLHATAQHWPLNAHDRQLLERLLPRADLPQGLRALCQAMREAGRKAEQEGWL